MIKQRSDYTFKHNRALGRHGWLRLTPAYSVKLVREIVHEMPKTFRVLDPFSGTATTGVAAAEKGLHCTLFDINPFLIWFGNLKLSSITEEEANALHLCVQDICKKAELAKALDIWIPPINNIERWWAAETLDGLARIRAALKDKIGEALDSKLFGILWISFARVAIESSAAAFNHVSVSFHDAAKPYCLAELTLAFETFSNLFIADASIPLSGSAHVVLHNSSEPFRSGKKYDALVTSPPYPNRISYIRELRPYMYWLGFLSEAKEAGELDWCAIGGTWGVATSRLNNWIPERECTIKSLGGVVSDILNSGQKNSELLSIYVNKYFHDIDAHIQSASRLLKSGAEVHYVIGNSTFYGIHVPTAKLYEESLEAHGFSSVGSEVIRKRNSKKELFEYRTYGYFGKTPNRKYNGSLVSAAEPESPAQHGLQLKLLERTAAYKVKANKVVESDV